MIGDITIRLSMANFPYSSDNIDTTFD